MRAESAARDWRAVASVWLVYAATLAFVPGGFVRFVFPKLLLVAAAVCLGALARAPGRLPRRVGALLAVFVALFGVAALASATPVASVVGRWPRYEGVPVIVLYAGCVWLGARLLPAGDRGDLAGVVTSAASWTSVVLGVTSLAQLAGYSVVGTSAVSRPGGLLGNATDQGLVGVLLVAVLLEPAFVGFGWLTQVGLVAAGCTVMASGSRSALLGVAVVVLVHLVALRPRRGVVVGALLGLGAVTAGAAVWGRLAATGTLSGRWLLWQESSRLAADHPVAGIGPSRFVDAVGAVHGTQWAREVGAANPPDSPHNLVLQTWLAGGVLLLVALLALVVVTGVEGVRRRGELLAAPLQTGFLAGVAAWGLAMLANPTGAGAGCLALFLAGAAVGQVAPSREGASGRRWWPALVAAVSGLMALGLVAATASEVTLQRGVDAVARGDLDGADRMFTSARQLRPLDGDVCMIAAQALAARTSAGDQAAAEPALRWARCSLDRTPDTLQSGLAASVALTALDRPAEAKARLDVLARLYPTSPDVFVQRAVAEVALGDLESAGRDLEAARALAPDDPRVAELQRRWRGLDRLDRR